MRTALLKICKKRKRKKTLKTTSLPSEKVNPESDFVNKTKINHTNSYNYDFRSIKKIKSLKFQVFTDI